MNKPTIIGTGSFAQGAITLTRQPNMQLAVVPKINTGAIVLNETQLHVAEQALSALDFPTMPAGNIINIGFEAEQALQRTLDGFLARLDEKLASQVFELFERLEKGVEDANLPEILKKIEDSDRPGFLAKLTGRFKGMKPQEVARKAHEEIKNLITGRTKTLCDKMSKLERELSTEMQKLLVKLQALEELKRAYRDHLGNFAVAAGVSQAFLEKAKEYVADEATRVAQAPDALAQAGLQEMQSKLQLLESRALALEGTYTRLPADQLVVQQIEQAGVATLQETATTAAARFGSIKMTLLAINGAFAVKGVQKLADKQAALDRQLTQVRGVLMKEIAVSAATAPGENRLAQAEQIEKIIRDTREIHDLVETARKVNEEKFAQARTQFQAMRNTLANIS